MRSSIVLFTNKSLNVKASNKQNKLLKLIMLCKSTINLRKSVGLDCMSRPKAPSLEISSFFHFPVSVLLLLPATCRTIVKTGAQQFWYRPEYLHEKSSTCAQYFRLKTTNHSKRWVYHKIT